MLLWKLTNYKFCFGAFNLGEFCDSFIILFVL